MTLYSKQLGDQGPLVVFESGIAATHLNWMGIAPRIAEFSRVFLYDRAGFGYSPAASEPRTARQCARELDPPEPAILVGHSFGSLIVRLFAEMHPERVKGLVLVDPILLHEWFPATETSRARQAHGIRVATWMARAARLGLVKLGISVMSRRKQKLSPATKQLLGEIEKLPPETWPFIRQHWSRPLSFVTMRRYLESLEQSCEDGTRFQSLGDIPLKVISGAHLTAEQRKEHEQWAALSSHGEHIVATEGRHWVHFDQPDLVVETIRQVCKDVTGIS